VSAPDWEGVLKVQRPLNSNSSGEALALVYSQDHFIDYMPPMTEVSKYFDNNAVKVYVNAKVVGMTLTFGSKASQSQDW
jgi:hypothetical protein